MRTTLPGRPPQARGLAGIVMLSLALVLTSSTLSGCSPDTASGPSGSTGAPGATASHVGVTTPTELTTSAAIGHLVGRLPGSRRKAVSKEVTAVIDRWWEAAYLAGDGGARSDLSKAFPGFTPGARKRATFDRDLMTNADLDVTSITPLMRKVRLDLLAVNQRARSVTARFDLRVRTTGERNRRLQVRGRLFLTRKAAGWQIFGYDVTKGWL